MMISARDALTVRQTMDHATTRGFAEPDVLEGLCAADGAALDTLDFGVIGFGAAADATVQRDNRTDSLGAGLALDGVLGRPLFSEVAQCMHNDLVAQRFEDALADGTALDDQLPHVAALRLHAAHAAHVGGAAPAGCARAAVALRADAAQSLTGPAPR